MTLRILRPTAAAAKLGISRMTLYRLEARGEIPPRLTLGAHSVGYREDQLDQWLRTRPAARETDGTRAPTGRGDPGRPAA